MTSLFGDDDGLIDLAEVTGAAAPIAPREFQPWHKPRKQYVRCRQWWFHIDRLLKRYAEYGAIETIKYFGLPGSDLLDVSYFSRQLHQDFAGKKLFIHGFIDSAQGKEKADLRLSELLDRDNVHSASKVENFNFHALSDSRALALEKIQNAGAYHLINLDFCDGVFNRKTINSMMTLLTYQLNTMASTPWLFFLTTRADKEGIAADLLEDLDRIFRESLKGDMAFLAAIEEHKQNIYNLIAGKQSLRDEEITHADLSEILQACFIFWAINLMHTHEARMEVTSTMKYKIYEGNNFPDMFSYVIRVQRNVVKQDSLGLGQVVGIKGVPFNEETKKKDKALAAKKLFESLNVDDYLTSNPELMRRYTDEMKALLEEAGWNTENYEAQMGI